MPKKTESTESYNVITLPKAWVNAYKKMHRRAVKAENEVEKLRAEIKKLRADRAFIVGFNEGWDEAHGLNKDE